MINLSQIKDVNIVNFKPDTKSLNLAVAQVFKNQVSPLISKPQSKVLINFNGIRYIDSTGIAVLISLLKIARTGNSQFKISNMSKDVYDLVKLMQLQNIFDIYPTQNEAVKEFK